MIRAISDVVRPDLVVEFDAADRTAALRTLVETLAASGRLPPDAVPEIVEAMRRREMEVGSTGIGGGVAMPHCQTRLVERIWVVIGRSRAPIEWNAIDGVPVRLVCCIVAPPVRPRERLSASDVLARFLSVDRVRRLLSAEEFPQEALDVAREFAGEAR
jgi:PTS system nitrogen regulatory IIA component